MRESAANRPKARPPARRLRPMTWFYRWWLPLSWGVTSWQAFRYPGDEYGLWGAGSAAGLWALYVFGNAGDIRELAPRVTLAGVVTVALIGWLLDWIRVPKRLWFAIWTAIVVAIVWRSFASYPTYARAISKNGSWQAYALFAANASLYLTTLLAAIVTPLAGWNRKRPRAGICPVCSYDLRGATNPRCPECGEDISDIPARHGMAG